MAGFVSCLFILSNVFSPGNDNINVGGDVLVRKIPPSSMAGACHRVWSRVLSVIAGLLTPSRARQGPVLTKAAHGCVCVCLAGWRLL